MIEYLQDIKVTWIATCTHGYQYAHWTCTHPTTEPHIMANRYGPDCTTCQGGGPKSIPLERLQETLDGAIASVMAPKSQGMIMELEGLLYMIQTEDAQ